jgi:hypothetical protein
MPMPVQVMFAQDFGLCEMVNRREKSAKNPKAIDKAIMIWPTLKYPEY